MVNVGRELTKGHGHTVTLLIPSNLSSTVFGWKTKLSAWGLAGRQV